MRRTARTGALARHDRGSPVRVQHMWVNHDHDLLDVRLHEDGQATEASTPDKAQVVATKAHGSQAPPSQDETIHTTAQHPWLTTDRGWVTAGDLRVSEHVVALGGHTATITALHVRPGAGTYYNLTVSTLHTYAVGASRAVVHNTGPVMCKLNDPSSEISQVSMWARIQEKIVPGRNVAVYRIGRGGSARYLAAASDAGARLHSEEILNAYLDDLANGLSRDDVTGIYSERIPCTSAEHTCMASMSTFRNAQDDISFSLNTDITANIRNYNAGRIGSAITDAVDEGIPAGLPGYQWIPAP